MNELSKTLAFIAVALALCGAAFVSTRDRSVRDEAFNDQGQPFFSDFKDPLACTDLEVVDFDPSTATASRFQVKFKDGKWVIPSHYRLSGRCPRPPIEDGGRRHGPGQGHGPLGPRRGPGRDGSDRPARHQDHHPEGPRQADYPARLFGEGPRRLHHRQRGQGQDRPALRARARPEANLRGQGQGRAFDPVRRLDRDQPAQARSQPHPQDRVRQLQGEPRTRLSARRGAGHRPQGCERGRGRWPDCPPTRSSTATSCGP